MEKDFTKKIEKSLNKLRDEIISNLAAGNQDFKQIVEGLEPKDMADIASDDIDRKLIETIGTKELNRLKLIESAITRIRQGKYGFCMKCGKKIPRTRLEALPYALLCIECKTEEERRNR
ncbi:conjugal transfer protein TraR [Spirochaetia bacterium]|nr:conjugal transfer protein TraR [Spirochaetia bacterium]